ncbi:hypothetical protein POG22_03310 [Geitlerinema sp. CS-897]|nr:hypothetical protein [Geitlerinema sp. CS-897]
MTELPGNYLNLIVPRLKRQRQRQPLRRIQNLDRNNLPLLRVIDDDPRCSPFTRLDRPSLSHNEAS